MCGVVVLCHFFNYMGFSVNNSNTKCMLLKYMWPQNPFYSIYDWVIVDEESLAFYR